MDYLQLYSAQNRYYVLVLFFVCWSLACKGVDGPTIVKISPTPNYRPATPAEIHSVEKLLEAIITITKEDLKLPAPIPFRVYLHKDTRSFAAAVSPRTNRDVTRLAAIAIDSEIHANLEHSKDIAWGEQIRLWAHEYAHIIHSSLGGDKLNVFVWLSEGFAEWFAAQVLNQLGWQDYSTSVLRAQLELTHHKTSLPPLSSLRNGDDWNEVSRQPRAWARSYSLAFFAVADLERRFRVGALLRYLTTSNFEHAFGEPHEIFENQLLAALQRGSRISEGSFAAPKPQWRIGDKWTTEEKQFGYRKINAKKIVRRERLSEQRVYLLEAGNEEYYYDEKSLALYAVKREGQFISRITNPSDYFSWPLVIGKKWRYTGEREELARNARRPVDLEMVVSSSEILTIGGQKFNTLKIEGFGTNSGRLLVEYWYSPTAQWFVKSRRYTLEGVTEDELVSYRQVS